MYDHPSVDMQALESEPATKIARVRIVLGGLLGLAVLSLGIGAIGSPQPHRANGAYIADIELMAKKGYRETIDPRTGRTVFIPAAPKAPGNVGGRKLTYGGGAVLVTQHLYVTYWGGEWATPIQTGSLATNQQIRAYNDSFLSNVGGSKWMGVASQYCQDVPMGSTACNGGKHITNLPGRMVKPSVIDATTVPSVISTSDLADAVVRAVHTFGYDPQGLYFIFTPSQHSTSGFAATGGGYCAYHSAIAVDEQPVAFANMPFQPDAPTGCGAFAVNKVPTLSGGGYLDGYSIVGGHELMEAITDPYPGMGWYDNSTNSTAGENGDKCAWLNLANQPMGAQTFAVQPTYSNAISNCSQG